MSDHRPFSIHELEGLPDDVQRLVRRAYDQGYLEGADNEWASIAASFDEFGDEETMGWLKQRVDEWGG